jgi:hypothetical protein
MWRPKEPDEEDVSNSSGIDPGSKRRRSRRQASRDGLADQTVIKGLENVRSCRAFEHSLIGIVDPRSLLELALIHRLASLLWRLRRANAIETGLFELQSELLITHRQDPSRGASQPGPLPTAAGANGHCKRPGSNGREHGPVRGQEPPSTSARRQLGSWSKSHALAQCFLRLSNLDPSLLDRVGNYETRLWRQAAQTIWTLEEIRRPPPAPTGRRFRKSARISYWDVER